MSLETFLRLGAEVVAGSVLLNRKEVGKFYAGELIVSAEGETVLAAAAKVEEPPQVDAKPATPQRKPRPKPEAPPPPPAAPEVTTDPSPDAA